ncbi:MAG TPA: hypothetical protein VK611_24855 [Acidimicrobiales bacterium]|nr:hypothetical protein [Acidimicrobiales bacterium]
MLLWEEEHWGGSWRGHDGGWVAAHVVPASDGRWLPVVHNDRIGDVTYGTLDGAKAAAEAAHALLPPPVPYKAPERYKRPVPNAPIRVPHPGATKRPQ